MEKFEIGKRYKSSSNTVYEVIKRTAKRVTFAIILNSNESDLIPFESKVKICDDENEILSYGIQLL